MESIRPATKQDIPFLCEIWKNCFPDSEEYIRCFYERNFERISVLAYCVDDKPVSIIHLIDASFENKDEHQKAKFIYATGTLPKYRKSGYMGALIEALTKKAREEGFALFLKPSSENLLGYYEKFGFVSSFPFQLVALSCGEEQEISYCDIAENEYNKMREEAFSDIPHVKWDDAHIRWCIEENEMFSGRTLKISYENKDYFLLGYPENKTLIINETNLSLNQLEKLSSSLCSIFGAERLEAYLCPHTCKEGKKTISNLVFNSSLSNPYVNMILI